ncbi:MAG: oxidoreductase [Dehalococcoidia bacterium]|nr:oxidoreductase [Dehalococcoidia bacterium]
MEVKRPLPWLTPAAGAEPMKQPLAGQVALVTGAGTGIGAAASRALAQAGASVGLIGRRQQPLDEIAAEIVQAGGEGWALPTDVADLSAVEAAVERCLALGKGRLDVLVNNAGINTKYRSLDNISANDWARVVDINLNGAYWCVRAVLPVMRQQEVGLIVNISSGAGRGPSQVSGVAYSATKTALASLNGAINQEEWQHGIRACVIYPGEVDTPMIDHRTVVPSAAARAAMMRPEDVANAILFVATAPPRVTIDELVIRPTVVRDRSEELPDS